MDDDYVEDPVVGIIKGTCREMGLEGIEVRHNTTVNGEEQFIIVKRFGSSPYEKVQYGMNFRLEHARTEHGLTDQIIEQIHLHSEKAARSIKAKISTDFEWGTYMNNVSVSIADGCWAECNICKEEVQLPPQTVSPAFSKDAETTTPNPVPNRFDRLTQSLSGSQEIALRLYLIGKLRQECDCQHRMRQQ